MQHAEDVQLGPCFKLAAHVSVVPCGFTGEANVPLKIIIATIIITTITIIIMIV